MANKALLDIVKIDKWLVMELIHDTGLSIRKLGEDPRVNRSEKTIRRWLNRWEMPKGLLLSIAQVLGISYSVLAIPTSDSIEDEKITVRQIKLVVLRTRLSSFSTKEGCV